MPGFYWCPHFPEAHCVHGCDLSECLRLRAINEPAVVSDPAVLDSTATPATNGPASSESEQARFSSEEATGTKPRKNPVHCSVCPNDFGCTFCSTCLKERESGGIDLVPGEQLRAIEQVLASKENQLRSYKDALEAALSKIEEAKAEAWDEGWIVRDAYLGGPRHAQPEGNPYRKEK